MSKVSDLINEKIADLRNEMVSAEREVARHSHHLTEATDWLEELKSSLSELESDYDLLVGKNGVEN